MKALIVAGASVLLFACGVQVEPAGRGASEIVPEPAATETASPGADAGADDVWCVTTDACSSPGRQSWLCPVDYTPPATSHCTRNDDPAQPWHGWCCDVRNPYVPGHP